MNSLVSIIIPIYNAELTLRTCLDSILNQSFHDIEVICIDDSSQDKTLDILHAYGANDSRIKILLNEKNSGPSIARNIGLEVASGRYVCFCDADDAYPVKGIQSLYNAIEKSNSCDICFGNIAFYDIGLKNFIPYPSLTAALQITGLQQIHPQ